MSSILNATSRLGNCTMSRVRTVAANSSRSRSRSIFTVGSGWNRNLAQIPLRNLRVLASNHVRNGADVWKNHHGNVIHGKNVGCRTFAAGTDKDHVEITNVTAQQSQTPPSLSDSPTNQINDNMSGIQESDKDAHSEKSNGSDNDDEMEQEEMFVQPDQSLGTDKVEWGGPRRGGRFEEPTRFGDWERKGRCTDF